MKIKKGRRYKTGFTIIAAIASAIAMAHPAWAYYSPNPPYESARATSSGTMVNLYGGTDYDASANKDTGRFTVHTWSKSNYRYSANLNYVGLASGYAYATSYFTNIRQRDILGMEPGTYTVTANLNMNDDPPNADSSVGGGGYTTGYGSSQVYATLYAYSYSCRYGYYGGNNCTTTVTPTVREQIACSDRTRSDCDPKSYLSMSTSIPCADRCEYVRAYLTIYASAYSSYSGEAVGSATGWVDSIQISNGWWY